MLTKIISGGQTGVDRAALDVALKLEIPCGGFCPAGRRAEDGPISDRYPLIETTESRYDARTSANVQLADGTLIISPAPLSGGTKLTRTLAQNAGKPLLIVHPNSLFVAELIDQWLKDHRIGTVNIAGPRESTSPGIYDWTYQFLLSYFRAQT